MIVKGLKSKSIGLEVRITNHQIQKLITMTEMELEEVPTQDMEVGM